jgi:hypothetical protein
MRTFARNFVNIANSNLIVYYKDEPTDNTEELQVVD